MKLLRKIRRAVFRDEPGYYDMFLNKGEQFFARLYLHEIREALRREARSSPLEILDAGCQAGRLSVPLAMDGHRLTGVDTSGLALSRARRHARECGAPIRLLRANLSRWLPRTPPGTFDAVVCTEVLYLRPNHEVLLEGLIRVLRPGGLCFISHRPTAYYLVEALQRRDKEAVRTVLSGREGTLFGSYYNWQDRRDLEGMYRDAAVELLRIVPIGFLSWLAVNPESLGPREQEDLLETELGSSDACPGGGRYLLVVGRKR